MTPAADIDDSDRFYFEIAQHCGRVSLTLEEREIAHTTRMAARSSYERQGITPPPSNLIGQVTWLITQRDLYKRELVK